ncbi:archaeosortase A [Haloarculaceae archaeon H-GB2-1]|nr:archaeosortase A [Haloarculaceae archaeon H-GB1-1]MEA5385893.1 archaeosortase A [Haloarculaceae archaeon H-GB11]MEA5407401.1 archaeosortase A [Haloarculaceae archaeon H-GB2-1]
MAVLRSITPLDVFFLGSVTLLLGGGLAYRVGREDVARALAGPAWAAFSAFWLVTAVTFLRDSRTFLGLVGLVTVAVAGYATTLVVRRRHPGPQLTVAFGVMAALFVTFEFVEPVYRFGLTSVAAHTAWSLSVAGFEPVITQSSQGYATGVTFLGAPLGHGIRLVSACSGISAITLFVGLISASDAPLRKRVVASVSVAVVIYALNVIRTTFVAGSIAGQWFAAVAGPVSALYGVSDPGLVSYYVAEYVLAQILVVVVLLGVYRVLTVFVPELEALVDGVLDAAVADLEDAVQR